MLTSYKDKNAILDNLDVFFLETVGYSFVESLSQAATVYYSQLDPETPLREHEASASLKGAEDFLLLCQEPCP